MWLGNATLGRLCLQRTLVIAPFVRAGLSLRRVKQHPENALTALRGRNGVSGRSGRNCRQGSHFRSPSRLLHHLTLCTPIGYTVC